MIKELEDKEGLLPVETGNFLKNVYKEFCRISDLCTKSKNSEYINNKLKKLNECMNDLSYGRKLRDKDITDENLIKEGKAIFLDIKRCLLEDKLENALSYLEKNGENIDGFESEKLIGIPKIIEDLKNGKEVTSDMINGTGNYEPNNDNIDPTKLKEELKKEISNWSKKFSIWNVEFNTLETLMVQRGTDLNSDGYGKFMQKVMGRYMKEISLIDKRSMVAAGIRYYQKSNPSAKPEKNDEDYERAKRARRLSKK